MIHSPVLLFVPPQGWDTKHCLAGWHENWLLADPHMQVVRTKRFKNSSYAVSGPEAHKETTLKGRSAPGWGSRSFFTVPQTSDYVYCEVTKYR